MRPTSPLIGIPVYKSKAPRPPHEHLYALHSLYSAGVVRGGGAPVQIPHGLGPEALRAIFERVDGLLLPGGGDVDPAFYGQAAGEQLDGVDRERDELEMALVRWAMAEDKPLLAICRGHQVLNVALGGNLYQDLRSDMPGAIEHAYFQKRGYAHDYRPHAVDLDPAGRLAHLLGGDSFAVNSRHHQGIKDLAPALVAVGHAPDGLVEAVEAPGHPFVVGVQWHPESLAPQDPVMQRLFDALVRAARDGRHRRL